MHCCRQTAIESVFDASLTWPAYLREPAVVLLLDTLAPVSAHDVASIVVASPALLQALECSMEVSVDCVHVASATRASAYTMPPGCAP
jgi:hypothetical protein